MHTISYQYNAKNILGSIVVCKPTQLHDKVSATARPCQRVRLVDGQRALRKRLALHHGRVKLFPVIVSHSDGVVRELFWGLGRLAARYAVACRLHKK